MNRNNHLLALIEDDMAAVAEAKLAVRSLWTRVRHLARRPSVTVEDLECIGEELRTVEAGLNAVTHYLSKERNE